ncbi:hypothetical protein PAMA_003882 [Pampus argenteus]
MTSSISIALLLLSATVVNSCGCLEEKTADGNFPLKVNQHAWERGASVCEACKLIVNDVQNKLHGDNSKEKIGRLLKNACDKAGILRHSCKNLINKSSTKLIDAIAEGKSPSFTCAQLKFCD